MTLPKRYLVFLRMYINDYIKISIPNTKHGQSVAKHKLISDGGPLVIEMLQYNPSPERIVQVLISKIGSATMPREPEVWKKVWLTDENRVGKSYNIDMTLEEFVEVLHKEGVITIEEVEEIPKPLINATVCVTPKHKSDILNGGKTSVQKKLF